MDDYTALSDDSFDDFIVSRNFQEKQNSKDIKIQLENSFSNLW